MDAHDHIHGNGKHAERIIVPQVLLGRKWNIFKVRQRSDLSGRNPRFLKALSVKGTIE
jgi:hypothetical protein